MDGFNPVKGKCVYWRESLHIDDKHDMSIKPPDKRVVASCFVEGDVWEYTASTVPADCPRSRQCRYHIKST